METKDNKIKLENKKLQDFNIKMKIASNVVKACQVEAKRKALKIKINFVSERTHSYTKADHYLIYKAKQMKKYDLPYSQYEEEKKQTRPLGYENLRKTFIDSYLKNHIIPSLRTMKGLYNKDISFSKSQLTESGFTWTKIPGVNKYMVTEQPEKFRKRCEYLSKLAHYRSEGKNFVYIDEGNISTTRQFFSGYELEEKITHFMAHTIVAANRTGVIHVVFDSKIEGCLNQFIARLVTMLPTPSVIILGDRQYHEKNLCPLPKPESSKKVMCDFLTFNEIIYDPDFSKAELYTLIQKCKHNCKNGKSTIELLLNGHDHVVLRRPLELKNLNFFQSFWNEAAIELLPTRKGIANLKADLVKFQNEMRIENWERMEDELIEREVTIYTEDLQVEEIIDRILMMAKYEKLNKGIEHLDTEGENDFSDVILLE